jgi:xanthine dehydrogenase YagR molybdenum-binding subunit
MPPTAQENKPGAKQQGTKEESRPVRKSSGDTANTNKPDNRTEALLYGIPGSTVGVSTVERTVPIDEPPQLAVNSELKVIGKRVPRYDGAYKVSGTAKYPSDVRLPGMLYARFVSAAVAHARIRSIDVSAAQRHAGVKAVHVIETVRGSAELQDKSKEITSKYPIIRYAGQPIAAVAATTPNAAIEAARLIKVEYENLPFVLNVEEARQPGAPLVFPGPAAEAGTAGGGGGGLNAPQRGNVRGPEHGRHGPGKKGDVDKGLAESHAVVEATYRTQVQTHSALETHGVVADWPSSVMQAGIPQSMAWPRTRPSSR